MLVPKTDGFQLQTPIIFGVTPELLTLMQPGIRFPLVRKVIFPATLSEIVSKVGVRLFGVLDTTRFVICENRPERTLTESD
jgi:hypothetical protein